jgi:hypothetical protein
MAISRTPRKNHRRFPGIKGKRPDRREKRLAQVAASRKEWEKLSPTEKAARNPKQADKYLKPVAKPVEPVAKQNP